MMKNESIDCRYPDIIELGHQKNEKKILWVLLLTLTVMVVEIIYGYLTKSMALLADGYHMATHFGALLISYLVYLFARSARLRASLNFGTGKLLSLGGYTNAILLFVVAMWIVYESIEAWLNPQPILYKEALWVAVIGLIVNLISAWILGHDHDRKPSHSHGESQIHSHNHGADHSHENHAHKDPLQSPTNKNHDHNFKSALAHVISDAVTSVLAIAALLIGSWKGWAWLDPMMGIVGAVVIGRWSYLLLKATALELLDGKIDAMLFNRIKKEFADNNLQIVDFHIWNSGPNYYIGSAIVKKMSKPMVKSLQDFKNHIEKQFPKVHFTIEIND